MGSRGLNAAVLVAVALAGCGKVTSNETYEYSIAEDGSATQSDRHAYETLGDVIFSRTQKYKIVALTEAARQPHYLVISISKKVGSKVEARDEVISAFMRDGSYTFDCFNQYDVKIAKEEEAQDPSCSFKLLGVIKTDAPAILKKVA